MALYMNGQEISQSSGIPIEITGIDTNDATAIASDIKAGKTAYANGIKITGNFTYSTYYTGALSPESSVGNEGDLFFVVQE